MEALASISCTPPPPPLPPPLSRSRLPPFPQTSTSPRDVVISTTHQVTTTFGGGGQSDTTFHGKKNKFEFGEAEFRSSGSGSNGGETFGEAEFRRFSAFGEADFRRGGGWEGVVGQGARREPRQENENISGKGKAGGDQPRGVRALAVVGGVAANQELRRRLQVGREGGRGGGGAFLLFEGFSFSRVVLFLSSLNVDRTCRTAYMELQSVGVILPYLLCYDTTSTTRNASNAFATDGFGTSQEIDGLLLYPPEEFFTPRCCRVQQQCVSRSNRTE